MGRLFLARDIEMARTALRGGGLQRGSGPEGWVRLGRLCSSSESLNTTARNKRYGNSTTLRIELRKVPVFLGEKRGRKTVRIVKNYGGGKHCKW